MTVTTTYRSRARRRTRRLLAILPCAVLALVLTAAFRALDVPAPVPGGAAPASGGAASGGAAPASGGAAPASGRAAPVSGGAAGDVPPAGPVVAPTVPASASVPSSGPGAGAPGGAPRQHVGAGSVALTIDDGPDPRWTPQVLALLRANGIRATFCLVGTQVRAHPELVRQIAADGHALCDHTESHDIHLPSRSAAGVRAEVGSGYDDIVAAAGVRPAYFRAPGGNWSPAILTAADRLGMVPLGWSVDPRDWARPGTASIAATVGGAPGGSIVLVHDGGGDRSQTVAALRTALPALQARGLAFVTP